VTAWEPTLKDLIAALEAEDPTKVCPIGFHHPHSYRGYYQDLAFEPCAKVTVGSMLRDAKSAIGQKMEGWKGGLYEMDLSSNVWLAPVGECGETLGPTLVRLMLERANLTELISAAHDVVEMNNREEGSSDPEISDKTNRLGAALAPFALSTLGRSPT
jgi:hypothetical protein